MASDTECLTGGPIFRYGGKGQHAHLIVPHFAKAKVYAEPCFGAGSIFFRIPVGTYEREAVNDLDDSLVTFFKVLRDHPAELVRLCEATPYARTEFIAALERSPDPLEEARRVWVRGRQGFSGKAKTAGDWGRNPGDKDGRGGAPWLPGRAVSKGDSLPDYARRLRNVAIDCIDATEFVTKWGRENTMLYADPPYVPESRSGRDYEHEMTQDDHRRLASALRSVVERGGHVAISGYPSRLYDEELFPDWRRMTFDVALHGTKDSGGMRRTEVLWCSYPVECELGYKPPRTQMTLFGSGEQNK